MSCITGTCVTARSVGTVCVRVAASVIRQTFVDICSNADTVKRHIKGLLGMRERKRTTFAGPGISTMQRSWDPEGACFIENGRPCVRNPCQSEQSKAVRNVKAGASIPTDQCLPVTVVILKY